MMQQHGGSLGIRGEAIWDNFQCFSPAADYTRRQRLVKAGYITEIFETFKSINNGVGEDVLGNGRAFATGCLMLEILSKDNAANRAAIKKAEVVQAIKEGVEKNNRVQGSWYTNGQPEACSLLRILEEKDLPSACL